MVKKTAHYKMNFLILYKGINSMNKLYFISSIRPSDWSVQGLIMIVIKLLHLIDLKRN